MDINIIIWSVIASLMSSIITIICCNLGTARGTLRIDHTNPEKDVYRFEINDLDKLKGKNYITLKIDHNAKLSQD